MDDFERCVTRKKLSVGYSINCKLNLWSVVAPTRKQAEDEAVHYFEQYKSDGEYSSIIGGDDVLTVLRKMLNIKG